MRPTKEIGMVVIFLALFFGYALLEAGQRGFAATFSDPVFLGPANLLNLTRIVGIFGIFSVGMALVVITGGIDLTMGSMFALLGVILAKLFEAQMAWPLAVLIVVAVGMLLGLVHGVLITRVNLQPFVVTLCGLLIYRGMARFLTRDQTVGFGGDSPGFDQLRELTTGEFAGLPAPFWAFLAVCAIFGVVLHLSVYGRYLFAIGRNEEAALYSGISTKWVITGAYVLCALLTAVSGIFLGFYTNSISPASHGNFYELYAVAAAVLGGCSLRGGEGSVLGVFVGVGMIQILRNIVNLQGIDSSLEFVVMGGVILVAVVLDQVLAAQRRARESRLDLKAPSAPTSPTAGPGAGVGTAAGAGAVPGAAAAAAAGSGPAIPVGREG